jgi:predicted RND superfamily exporter protein
LREISDKLASHPQVERVFSSIDLLQLAIDQYLFVNQIPQIPEAHSQATEAIIDGSLPGLNAMHFVARDAEEQEVWRITSLTSALGDTKYNQLLTELEQDVQQTVFSLRASCL